MKRMLLCAALLLGISNANATLISANDAVYGSGSLTQDTVTGLEWLDLTISQGFSYNNVINGTGNSFLANGFVVATMTQVEALLTNAGWNGADDSANSLGVTNHLATVTTLINLLGTVGTNAFPGELAFTEGLALIGSAANVANDGLGRQFNTITQFGVAGRIACTTVGVNQFPNQTTNASSCRVAPGFAAEYFGVYLVRRTVSANVPEPSTWSLMIAALAGVWLTQKRRRSTIAR
jgi:hypothetical protein